MTEISLGKITGLYPFYFVLRFLPKTYAIKVIPSAQYMRFARPFIALNLTLILLAVIWFFYPENYLSKWLKLYIVLPFYLFYRLRHLKTVRVIQSAHVKLSKPPMIVLVESCSFYGALGIVMLLSGSVAYPYPHFLSVLPFLVVIPIIVLQVLGAMVGHR